MTIFFCIIGFFIYAILSMAAEMEFDIYYHSKLSIRLMQTIAFALLGWLLILMYKTADYIRYVFKLHSLNEFED